jgi:hypothetical protein
VSDNSLTINGLEMLGYDTNPEYHLGAGLDFGSIAPDTTTISSLLLDGDRIIGDRTGNKTWNLIVVVLALDGERSTLSVNVDALLQAVNTSPYQVVWTPDGCPPTVFTAYRATAVPAKRFAYNDSDLPLTEVTLQFSTDPFGESSSGMSISVPATGGPTQQVLDSMDTGTFTAGSHDTTHEYSGGGCMAVTMTRTHGTRRGFDMYGYISPVSPTPAGRAVTSVDLSSFQSISYRFRWDQTPFQFTVNADLILKDVTGKTATAQLQITMVHGDTAYRLVRFPISKFAALDLTQIVAWSVGILTSTQIVGQASQFPATTTAYVDDLRVYPQGSTDNATGEGSVLTIPDVVGSARTPVAMEIDAAGTVMGALVVHRPPADQDPSLTILAGLSGSSVTIPAANADYDGTYSVVVLQSAGAGVGFRTITATFTQKVGGVIIGGPTTRSVTTDDAHFVKVLGEISLPLTRTPAENQSDSLTISVSGATGDVFTDILLLDTRGQTLIVVGTGSTQAFWVDTPDPLVGAGQVFGAATVDRTQAYSVMGLVTAYSGGPMLFDPGDNRLLVASPLVAPGITVTYAPRWLDEALDFPVAEAAAGGGSFGFGHGPFGHGPFGGS